MDPDASSRMTLREVSGVAILDATPMPVVYHRGYLLEFVTKLLGESKKKLLMNLSHSECLHEEVLADVVESWTTAGKQSAELKLLVDKDSMIHRYLAITRLAEVIEVFHDEDEAIRSFLD